jgi:hypothetical protein
MIGFFIVNMTAATEGQNEGEGKHVWPTDADYIKGSLDVDENKDLILTDSIKEFLGTKRDSTFFIIAPKGFGKTLLLKYKRLLYQYKYKYENEESNNGRGVKQGIRFIPEFELVDKPQSNFIFSSDEITLFKNKDNWTILWTISLSLSLLKNIKIWYEKKKDKIGITTINNEINHRDLKEFSKLIDDSSLKTPSDYLAHILYLGYNDFFKLATVQYRLTAIIRSKHIPVAIFIDNVDQCFEKHITKQNSGSGLGELDPDIWYLAQIGLMQAIWNFSVLNHHLKIFASIRKEALLKLYQTDAMSQQIHGSALDINYSIGELKEMFIKNIKKEDREKLSRPDRLETDPIFSFLGIKEVSHPHSGKKQDLFSYIYRHTLKRPRDFMCMGRELSRIRKDERTYDEIKRKINAVATKIAEEYLVEMLPHLDFFDLSEVYKFFKSIDNNLLSTKKVKSICSEFNNEYGCETKDCINCQKKHVFCNMYKVGLLGIIKEDSTRKEKIQSFLRPGEKTFSGSGVLPQSPYYLIHPVLNALIKGQTGKYEITDIDIIGDGIPWTALHTRNCSFNNDYPCESKKTLSQGVFLASSSENKEIVTNLGEKLKKNNVNLDVCIWTHNKGETGIVFCDEVCPKIYDNRLIIAEISDFNPNVFFESGFAAGLGRTVQLIRHRTNTPRTTFNMLHTKYSNPDELFRILKSNIKENELPGDKKIYDTPRIFGRIINFNSPEERGKNDKVFVLSFYNDEVIEKLRACGYVIVEKDRLSLVKFDLIRDIIDARALLVHLTAEKKVSNQNTVNDCKLMYLAGVGVAQGVPVKIFQYNQDFYSDVDQISLFVNSAAPLFKYVNNLPLPKIGISE